MIFDTGNTNILLDTQFFKEHFAPSPTLQRTLIQGTGNSLEAVYRDVAEWEYSVGATKVAEQGATVLDLRKILGYQVDGMFGMEFMRGRRVEFNYADGYMLLLPSEAQSAEGYVCVKCKWLDQRQARMVMPLSLKINDELSFDGDFLVDMGSSGSVSISSSLVAKLKLNRVLTDVRKKIYDTGGVGGSRTDYLFTADRVSVAGNDLLNVRMNYSGNTQGMMASDSYDGLVGNGLLEHFDVIIDFAKCEIWLRPNRNFNAPKRYDSGMTLTPQADGWIVNGLVEGGNAQQSGIRRGDLITSINGLMPNEVDIKRLKTMNASAEEWSLEVKRGDATSQVKFEKEKQ
ncbi:MAG: aspartyl protease family protein [Alistipes sp.]|nr:aspartyl protease family protein [Alistipes sp.]